MDTMKKGFIIILLAVLASACGKLPINGDLDGRWQIMKIEYASGEEDTPERAYYSIALHTINLMQVGGGNQSGNMEYTGDSLFVTMPISTKEDLLPFGMDSTTFRCKRINIQTPGFTIGLCPVGVQKVLNKNK